MHPKWSPNFGTCTNLLNDQSLQRLETPDAAMQLFFDIIKKLSDWNRINRTPNAKVIAYLVNKGPIRN